MPAEKHSGKRQLTVFGQLLLSSEDDSAPRPLGVWEGVAVLLKLVLGEQVLFEAVVQGSPCR